MPIGATLANINHLECHCKPSVHQDVPEGCV